MAAPDIERYKERLSVLDALPALLDALRNGGFRLGPGEYAAAHELLIRLAQHGRLPHDPIGLRTLLGPLLCTSPSEQAEFNDIFHAWAVSLAGAGKPRPEKPAPGGPKAETIRRFRFHVWLWAPIFLILALLLTGLLLGSFGIELSEIRWPSIRNLLEPEGWAVLQGKPVRFFLGLSAGLILLALILREAWFYLMVRRYLRRRSTDAPFDVQPFFVEARPGRLFQTIGIKRASQSFRRHQRMPAAELDIHATVEATAGRCGRFTPVKGFRYHAPEYLVLVDRAAFRDHQAEWVDALVDRLAENDVSIRRYYFNRDPRSCVPDTDLTGPLKLVELAGRYPEHRLIIFSDAVSLTDPFTGRPSEWIEQFYAWEQRGLMTLSPLPDRFSGGRTSLAHDFIVMPVDETGLTDLIDRMNGDPAGTDPAASRIGESIPRRIAEAEPTAPRPSDEADEAHLMDALKAFLGREGWHWLCACAVYPDIRWGLTLHLGRHLTGGGGQPLLTRDRLLKMIRLPWFRYGIMPDWLRRRLIDDDAFRGRRERKVRGELFALMRTAGESGTLRMEYARIQEGLIPKIVRMMRRMGAGKGELRSPLRDGIFLDFMANPLSVRIPRELHRFLKRYWPRGEGRPDRIPKERFPTSASMGLGRPKKRITNSLEMTFVYIRPGTFMMGSPESESERSDDETLHEVTLTRGFYMGTTQITQGQWQKVMGSNPSAFKDGGEDCPVESVSWGDMQEFISKLNALEGIDLYRLPTEAEWEYACRAGTDTPFFFGDCLSTDEANYDGNYPYEGCPKGEYRERPIPVGSLAANAWGLYDMHGNVWECCQDWYGAYPDGPVTDPVGPSDGELRVFRGGSWHFNAAYCRSAYRLRFTPGLRGYNLGFRLLRSLP